MHVLIVYCHPSSKSYTYEVLRQLLSSIKEENLEYEICDLYKMDFQSDMSESEYEREGFSNLNLAIATDVKLEHEKIEKADAIVFVYPVWWSDCPAKLKGWFDRVYSVGYAYANTETHDSQKMKLINYGLVICTAGHPLDYLNEIGIAESMRNVMIDDRLGKRFKEKEMIILGGTIDQESVSPKHSSILKTIGARIKENCI